jgi:hypothetical protein
VSSRRHPFLSRTGTFVTYEEVYGEPISYGQIVDLIQSLPVDYWVDIASKGRVFLEHYESKPGYQGILIHYFFPSSLLEVKIETHEDDGRFFFHRTQFLALLRLALLHGSSTPPPETNDEKRREITARCLLGISSLIYTAENAEGRPSFDTNGLMNKLSFDSRKQIIDGEKHFLMDLFLLYHNHLTENISSLIGRHKDMLFDIPNDESFATRGISRSLLSDVLSKGVGLSTSEYAALTFGVFAKYVNPSGIFKKEFHFPVDKDAHFSNTSINKASIERYFGAVCQSRSEFLKEQKAVDDAGTAINDFHSFMLKPLVHLDGSSKCYPASLTYLERLLGDGLTWVVAGGEYKQDLRNYWGQVFEFYCHKICQRIEANSTIKPRYFSSIEYGSPHSRRQSCDAIFVYGESAVMMEFKIKSPRLIDTVIGRDYDSLLVDIQNAFVRGEEGHKAAAQIDESIRGIRDGDLALPGVSPLSIRAYYPVVVTFQAWPLGPLIYELIRMVVQKNRLLRQTSYIAPLEIWSGEEFEYVESVLNASGSKLVSLPDLVREKLIGDYVHLPMATFLADRYSGTFPPNHYIDTKRNEMLRIVRETLSLNK